MKQNTILYYCDNHPCFLRNAAAAEIPPSDPQKIVIHLTDYQSKYLRRHLDSKRNSDKLPHLFVGLFNCGKVGVVEVLPEEWNSDMCGQGGLGTYDSGSNRAIQIAICRDNRYSFDYFHRAMDTVANLAAELCERYRLVPADVISAAEAYKVWRGEKTFDPDNYIERFGYTFDDFRHWVRIKIEGDNDLPIEQKASLKPKDRYVIAKGYVDGNYTEPLKEYIDPTRARKYCPQGYRIYNMNTGKIYFSSIFEPGVNVFVTQPIVYGALRKFIPEDGQYTISEISGKRAVIVSPSGKRVAVSTDNLTIA